MVKYLRNTMVPLLLFGASLTCAASSQASESVKIGMITTLSGGGSSLGIDIRDGFKLAVDQEQGKLGGYPVELLIEDDARNPGKAKQIATRLTKKDKVDILTGIVWSNLAMAVVPSVTRSGTVYISPNAGPSKLAGDGCSPNYFNVAWQNDNLHEAMGQYVTDKGYKKVYILAPNYPAGKDALTGFKRFYKGDVVGEVYTKLGQTDYATELAALRAAKPDAVFFFLPGGMGISFLKQYQQAGLNTSTPLFGPAFSFDQGILKATGDSALGIINSSQWSKDLDNAANLQFVSAFQQAYGRLPSLYASQGYDAARLIASALKNTQGNLDDKETFRSALKQADFDSVRGAFRFGNNQHPIQDIYIREVFKDDKGVLSNRVVGVGLSNHQDAYASQCTM
ncbi:ABC transporter substrate-binding protein [Aestuariirhabdus sp. Z084]|uniref:ABC transporter substrate-binding protein n=1 Tax=Aestuariirhabdus haliotis TaxID=2918751 RepID=UPI00201B35F6|nr:ABC transporter substrate-binding protein [Aestuariirhabdus haliotis]MCL6417532.1 ABC transporter substrate-binding protein [Aestuariirhabdus haliotis]MCL6421475.1 ABC transporter substrate-binding protein [Aestuariirhabdus haliotis]